MTTTPSFVTEISLKVTPSQERALNKRFEVARQDYNACLGECLKRLDLMRESKAWQKARLLPKGKNRTDTFKVLNETFNATIADARWSGVGSFLQAALDDIDQTGPASFGLNRRVAADRL